MAYYTLVASLPHLPPHFDVERNPITRPRLVDRLKLLNESDATILQQLIDFLTWDRQPLDQTDEQVVREYERVTNKVRHPLVLEIVDNRMNIRTIVSALRRRRGGEGPPTGVGQLVAPIRRHWNDPHFRLHRQFPFIEEFEARMSAGDAVSAERALFEFSWRIFCRVAAEFTFSFEAVLLYLARWEIVDRWTSRDADAGGNRFEQLIEETLGDYTALQF